MREEIKVIIGGNSEGAQQAIAEVGNKAENVLGKRMGSIVSKAFSALPMAGMVAGVALVGQEVLDLGAKATAVSDKFASIKARIDLINDGSQSTASIMDKVYQASERSRGSYTDMLDSVAKLNMLAKDSFSSNDEAIRFVEQLNMQFKLSGAQVGEVSSAMTQLTQAMAAGRLQGDEFNSIMENAPMLAQAISQEMGVPIGQLKQLGSEGKITADVIKSALFNSADETQAKFAEMPMTFQEVGQQLSNAMFQSFQPVLEEISSMTASAEFKTVIDGIVVAIQGMAVVAKGAISGVKGAFNGLASVITTSANIWKGIFTAPSIAIRTYGTLVVGLMGYFVGVRIASMAFASSLTVQKVATMAVTAVTRAYQGAVALCNTVMTAFRARVIAGAIATGTASTVMAFARGVMMALRGSISLTTIAQKAFNMVLKANPIGIVVALLSALAAAFIGPKIATEGLGATMSSIWNSIVHTVTWAINQIIRFINKLTSAFNSVSGVISKVLNVDIGKFGEISEISADDAEGFANKTQEVFGDMASAFTGGGTTTAETATESGGGGGGGGSDNSLQQAIEEAKRAHEQMTDSYRQMFGTKVDEVEAWRKKELEELDKSKEQNANYNEDLRMLNEMYAKKREQAVYEEAKRIREIQNEIRDMDVAFHIKIATTDSTGSVSPFEKLNQEHAEAMREIANRHQKMSDDFAEKTDRDKKVWLDSLKEQNIAYELSEDGRITYSERKRQEELAQLELFNKKRAEIARTGAETEFAIQEALRTQNFDALQTALTDEYVAQENSYEMKKDLMNQYIEAVKESHFSLEEMMDKSVIAGMNTISDSINGLLQGTATLTQAIQNLGKAMLKAVMDYISNWAAQSLKSLVFGQMLQRKQETASIASANAQIPSWSQLALQMSLATAGASATAGMAAYTTATSAGTALSGMLSGNIVSGNNTGTGMIQPKMKMATGGLAYGRTFAEIGEGQYPEAVLPLSDTVFSRLGEGIRENGGGSNITLNVSAIDAHSFGSWLEHTGGKVLRQFTANTEREFGTEVGVW